jgi:AcrR family transcriptional regulator
VTLRAVARRVGISAPSIYGHFSDRAAIVDAIVDAAFADFDAAIAAARDAETAPLARLRVSCAAYLRFAEQHPNRYRLLFERRDLLDRPNPVASVRTAAFDGLVDAIRGCIDGGVSSSTDAVGAATAIWAGLHGYASLRNNLVSYPWPEFEATLDLIVCGGADIRTPESRSSSPR